MANCNNSVCRIGPLDGESDVSPAAESSNHFYGCEYLKREQSACDCRTGKRYFNRIEDDHGGAAATDNCPIFDRHPAVQRRRLVRSKLFRVPSQLYRELTPA